MDASIFRLVTAVITSLRATAKCSRIRQSVPFSAVNPMAADWKSIATVCVIHRSWRLMSLAIGSPSTTTATAVTSRKSFSCCKMATTDGGCTTNICLRVVPTTKNDYGNRCTPSRHRTSFRRLPISPMGPAVLRTIPAPGLATT